MKLALQFHIILVLYTYYERRLYLCNRRWMCYICSEPFPHWYGLIWDAKQRTSHSSLLTKAYYYNVDLKHLKDRSGRQGINTVPQMKDMVGLDLGSKT
jgi:hypothetical protein